MFWKGGSLIVRKNNPKQTIESIVTPSAKLFAEKGYEKTNMQNIVEASGVSKGAIFHRFKTKEEILDAVMEQQFELDGLKAKDKLIEILKRNMLDEQFHSLNDVVCTSN